MNADPCDYLWSARHTDEGWRRRLWLAVQSRALRMQGDRSLVRRARAHDIGAFDALAARYRSRLQELAMCPAGNNREGAARRESILTAFHDIDSFAVKCCPGTWLYLNGLRAAFAHMNAPADPYPIGDSAEAATALPASPRAA